MRKFWWIIPIVVFIASVLTASAIVNNRRDLVTEMINRAAANGEPVILTSVYRPHNLNFAIVSLRDEPVGLVTQQMGRWGYCSYFTDSGILINLKLDYRLTTPTGRELRLPEIYPVRRDISNLELLSGSLPIPNHNTYKILGRFIGKINGDTYSICDLHTGELTEGEFSTPSPWSEFPYTTYVSIYLSPNASDLVFLVTGALGTENNLYRYNLESEVWIDLGLLDWPLYIVVGPDCKVLALVRSELYIPSDFINGETGDIYESVDLSAVTIGRRWIVYRDLYIDNELTLVDTADGWKKYKITFDPSTSVGSLNFLYEPPPGGVDEMLRMRAEGIE